MRFALLKGTLGDGSGGTKPKVIQELAPPGQGYISQSPGELLLGLTSGNTAQEVAGTRAHVCIQSSWVACATHVDSEG